jgi:hypothetical protein
LQDLDDNLLIISSDELLDGVRLTDATPGAQIIANDNTSVLDDLAASADYSVTLKDDGKALYRWGGLIKRPNDIRMYARLALPDEWKVPGADYEVTKARLVVNHWITNNPNDQLRPEDLENEAATGRKPDYKVVDGGAVWKSTKTCYEGDGDVIDDEDGSFDPTVIGVGTYFKNMPFAVTGEPGADEPGADPYPFSSDLPGALTNAYFTTIERDPFEWSYELVTSDVDGETHDFTGCAGPIDDPAFAEDCTIPAGATLASGPRWRLKPNKFGQDIPGLEIPVIECSPPPFTKENIKYNVGDPVTTVINLLDWEDENGPLATSKGWVDTTVVADPDITGRCMLASNPDVTIVNVLDGTCTVDGPMPVTSNGLPMTEDFDLAVYVKGDRKATALYNAYLEIEYDGEGPPPTDDPVCGPPTDADPATDNAVFLWNSCTDPQQWYMRLSAGGATKLKYTGVISAAPNGFNTLIGNRLEANDVVIPTPPVLTAFAGPITYALIVQGSGVDGIDFRVNNVADGCFGATLPDVPVYVGSTRVEIDAPFSLATFEACTP